MSRHHAGCARRLRADMLAEASSATDATETAKASDATETGETTGATDADETAGTDETAETDVPPLLIEAIATAITRCCGHRPLQARRLAHGWTIEQAVAAFHAMCQEHKLGARGLAIRSWQQWEAGDHPNADYQDLLCRLFRADPVSLGFSRAYPEAEWSPLMNGTTGQDKAAAHDYSCAHRIRVLRLAQAGDPPSPPASLLHAIAAEIGTCCGQPPLRAHRLACGWTVSAAIRALNRCCTEAGLRPPGVSHRAWQDWEAGNTPNRHNQDLLCRLFATGPVELGFARDYAKGDGSTDQERPIYTVGKGRPAERGPDELATPARLAIESAAQPGQPQPAGPGNLAERSLVMNAAHESSDHAAYAESASIGPNALEQIGEDIIGLARAYLHTPPLPLFGELTRVRDRAYWLLDRTRKPAQQRDLYLVAGQACGLLASASLDLGYPRAAAQQARTARTYGEIIDHKELSAWADFMLSVTEDRAGRPGQALLLAERGLSISPEGTCQAHLWSQVARAAALHGNEQRAVEAITASRRASDDSATPTELHDHIGGEFGFSPGRQAFNYGSTYLKLGLTDETLAESRQAIELYTRGAPEERSFLREAGARADMAAAHLLRDDLDGAREALGEVLALEPGKRVEAVVRRVGTLREVLAGPGFQHRAAQSLAEEIEQFTASPAGIGVPAPTP